MSLCHCVIDLVSLCHCIIHFVSLCYCVIVMLFDMNVWRGIMEVLCGGVAPLWRVWPLCGGVAPLWGCGPSVGVWPLCGGVAPLWRVWYIESCTVQ